MNLKHGIQQIGVVIDQLGNVVLGNPFSTQTWADETISSRCGRIDRQPYRTYRVVIDALWYYLPEWMGGGPDHCRRTTIKERQGRHLPPELRTGKGERRA